MKQKLIFTINHKCLNGKINKIKNYKIEHPTQAYVRNGYTLSPISDGTSSLGRRNSIWHRIKGVPEYPSPFKTLIPEHHIPARSHFHIGRPDAVIGTRLSLFEIFITISI